MPIQVKCKCGKVLKVPDAMVGKAVKCPACQQPLKVPAAGGAGASKAGAPKAGAPKAASPPPSTSSSGRMDELFNEEGFSETVETVCPVCRAPMPSSAVLCTQCGYHRESGTQYEAHKTAGVDIDHGTLALRKAQADIVKDREMQQTLLSGGGMPWWMLALILFVIGSGLTIAVLVVNASRRVDESVTFNPLGLFFLLAGIAFGLVALGAYWMILVHAVKSTGKMGLLVLLPPYGFYHVYRFPKPTWKFLLVALVGGCICGGLLAAASSQGI